MLALYDIGCLGQMNPVRAVHTLQTGQLFVDLEDHGAGVFKNRAPGVVGDAQTAVALVIGGGHGDKGHIHLDMMAVQVGQRAQDHGHELHQTAALQLALVVADVPAVVVEAGLLRVALHHFDARTDHKTAADLHIGHLALACGQRLVQQLGIAAAKAVVDPVTGLHGLDRLLGRDIFALKLVDHIWFLPFYLCTP